MFERLHGQRQRDPAAIADGLQISSQRDGDRHTVTAVGELDLATAWQLEHELRRIEATDAREIVLDLRGLLLLDSAGVRVLLDAGARSRAQSKPLMLLSGADSVQQRLEWSGLTTLLAFVDRNAAPSLRAG